jgi:alpha-glucosidase (family GH31 glycosyl hydrolase)
VYLPAGANWYNFWTNECVQGGQRIKVEAPIDKMPMFVRAGSVIPVGAPVESTNEKQAIASVWVYPGADADFALYNDDGLTYAYENGESQITHLHWSNAAKKLEHTGAAAWTEPDDKIVRVMGMH